ncbi:MAG: ATP-dependent helicase UvrD/PcrA [Thermoleophilaceae bacterium]|jgi:DNA helicase-2/ATP-dependent DNA helicase PcrA|nr:ATP-dependent helicase UvrD/PcrA [Thermoleophilaceae bacterium]
MPQLTADLSSAQLEAVTHPGGPLLVRGAPGTGKTRALLERHMWLVREGVPADSVLLLAYSKPAAAEARERLETAIQTPWEELWACTFRSFCARLLRDEALEAGVDPFFVPVTPADRLALLLDRIDDLHLRHHAIRGNPAPLLGSFVARIDRLKEEMVRPPDLRRHAEALVEAAGDDADRAHAARELELAQVYERHEALLAARGALDGGDLLLRSFDLLHEHPHVRRRVGERFRHVLVDEYQDASFAQATVLRLLCEEHGNVTVAGDPGSAVHRLRGAGAKNLDDFEREHPGAKVVRLERNQRSGRRIVTASRTVAEGEEKVTARAGGEVLFWHCRSDRAQAQRAALEVERLVTGGAAPEELCVLVRDASTEGALVGSALEERGIPFRLAGAAAYFQRSEVRDVIAWLRLLADPGDSGAVVRALSRPPIELRQVDIARLTQLARRRKLDMVSGIEAACESPGLSPEGRDRALAFLRVYRAGSRAFEEMPPDRFVHRLIERIGLRRQQVFAHKADTVERLVNIAKLADLAAEFVRREPGASSRDFARYLAAVAEAGLPEEEAAPADQPSNAVQVVSMREAKGLEFDTVLVLGLSAAAMPGPRREPVAPIPGELLKESLPERDPREEHEAAMRRLLHLAMTRARKRLVLSWAEGERGSAARPSPFLEDARAAVEGEVEEIEEELFGPAEGLHSTFRMMRDELLDSVAHVGGRLGEMRLDTYLEVSRSIARYLELLKLAALIERGKAGQPVSEAIGEVNELLLQGASPEQAELFRLSALDDYLLDTAVDETRRRDAIVAAPDDTLEPFIPRRGEGLMLSASDIETYRLCPLKYKFARVFRIPQEPSINQRFGIVVHQVLERFHVTGGGSLDQLMQLFEAAWRRSGFGESNDDLQFRERAVAALRRYWELDRERESEPVSFERSFSFHIGPHLLRGRVDRVDRHPDGSLELIDYKTGKAKTEADLREDVQLSIYQMGAREAWGLETAAQSYYYVLENEKVPVAHSEEELERVRGTVTDIGERIMAHRFEPKPSFELCSFCDYRIICPAAEK